MKTCWEVLGLDKATATEPKVRLLWRELAKTIHPDVGGNVEEFVLYQKAYKEALAFVTQRVVCPVCNGKKKTYNRSNRGGFQVQHWTCPECRGEGTVRPKE